MNVLGAGKHSDMSGVGNSALSVAQSAMESRLFRAGTLHLYVCDT